MKTELLKYAWSNVRKRKMRSWLTVISILIGITAIYALISFGMGLSSYIDEISAEMGTDKLMIMPKGTGPLPDEEFFLTKNDIEFVQKIKGVDTVIGLYFKGAEIKYRDVKKYTYLISLPVEREGARLVEEMWALEIVEGRNLDIGDKFNVVLGYNYQFPEKIFEKPIKAGDKVEVNGVKVKVIGFFEEVGNPQDDSQIYISPEGFEEIQPELKDRYGWIMARVSSDADPTKIAEKVEEKLRKFKGQEEGKEEFSVQTFEQAMEAFTNIMVVINSVLIIIALISMLVAGVNITNTMYTAVVERTKEIGIIKSIGAKNRDIVAIFLFESGILGLVGGAFGVITGYIVASIGGAIAAASVYAMLKPIFPASLTIGCLMFAFIVGALAGLMPARQASKLKPVDALRYE